MKRLFIQNPLLKISAFYFINLLFAIGFSIQFFFRLWGMNHPKFNLVYTSLFFASLVLNIYLLIGINSKKLFQNKNNRHLAYHHFLLFYFSFLMPNMIDSSNSYRIITLVVAGFNAWVLLGRNSTLRNEAFQGAYWKYELEVCEGGLSLIDLEKILKKEFYLIKTSKDNEVAKIEAFGLWAFKATVELTAKSLKIQVEPMLAPITMFCSLKVIPLALGGLYGKRILEKIKLLGTEK